MLALVAGVLIFDPLERTRVAGVEDINPEDMDQGECPELTDPTQKEQCYQRLAVARGQVELCEFVGVKGRDVCKREVANRTRNVSACLAIQKDFDRNVCLNDLAQASKTPDACLRVTFPSMRVDCVGGIAKQMSDPRVCERLPITEEVETCKGKAAVKE